MCQTMTIPRRTKSSSPRPSVYEQVARSTHEHFGADAVHYVTRLIEIHTRKQPALLSKAELMSLLDWIRAAATFFAEDTEKLEQYMTELFAVAVDTDRRPESL